MTTKKVAFIWSETGLNPQLKFRRSADNLIMNASGAFEVSPSSYPIMIEDTVISGLYVYDMSLVPLNDGEYIYAVFDPVANSNIGENEVYVYQNSFVILDIPIETIVSAINALAGGNVYPFISVQNISISDGQPIDYISGDAKPLYFYLPAGWDVTLKHTFLCIKRNKTDADSIAIINAECSIIDGMTLVYIPTVSQTSVEGLYYGELTQYDDVLGTVNPMTAMEFTIDFQQRIRD